jgi:hypothetical protein
MLARSSVPRNIMPPEFSRSASANDEALLEARIETLEFLVLGLLRGLKDNQEAKWALMDAFELMTQAQGDGGLNRPHAHRRLSKRTYAEMLLLAWGKEDEVTSSLRATVDEPPSS